MFGLLAFVSLAIGAGFAAAGAWLVLPFAGLEAAGLAAAFLFHARAMQFEPDAVPTPRRGSGRRPG